MSHTTKISNIYFQFVNEIERNSHMTDDVITLDVTWEDILRQMLSCFGLRTNCQSYKAFLKNASKDSRRFFMIIVIYFYSYHYYQCHCYYYSSYHFRPKTKF